MTKRIVEVDVLRKEGHVVETFVTSLPQVC